MKLNIWQLWFLLYVSVTNAQQITVVNAITDEPISGVAIFNSQKLKSAITNFKGVASIDKFMPLDTLYFKHLSHITTFFIKKDIPKTHIIHLKANTQGLNQIIISSSKFKQNKNDIPQKVSSSNAKSIALNNPQTAADVLQNTGVVFVQKSQLGGGSPIIRGFSTNRLLITVDGVRMNNAIFRGGNIHNVIAVDPLSIERTEVILGPGSVIYGSDAIGGVMSFYTKEAQVSNSDTLQTKANMLLRYASASNEKTSHIDINIGKKKWAFLTSATYNNFDDLVMGSHGPKDYLRQQFVQTTQNGDVIVTNRNPKKQVVSGYNQFNISQKIKFKPEKKLSFNLGLHYSKSSNIPRYDRLIQFRGEDLRSAEWHYGPQVWFMSNLQVTKLSRRSNFYDKAKVTLAYQNFKESRIDRDFGAVDRRVREEGLNAYTFNLDFEKRFNKKTRFFYGSEYVFNTVKSKANLININSGLVSRTVTRYPNGASWASAALYTSLKYKPNTKFVFQSGLRFNHVTSKANFTENNTFLNLPFNNAVNKSSAVTGTMGLTCSPNTNIQYRFNVASAFRAPNIDDIGKVFNSEPGSVVVPNKNLKPEYAYGGELGLNLHFNKNFTLDMSAYYTYLDNALVRRDFTLNGQTDIVYDETLSNVQAIQNASKAWIYGFEFGVKLILAKHLNLTSQYSIVNGTEENNNTKVPIRHVAPNFGNLHLTWRNKIFILDAFANYNDALAFTELAPSEREKDFLYALDGNGNPYSPAWYTLNIRSQFQIQSNTTITATLENITDQRYRPYSSGISAPGINVIVALSYRL